MKTYLVTMLVINLISTGIGLSSLTEDKSPPSTPSTASKIISLLVSAGFAVWTTVLLFYPG